MSLCPMVHGDDQIPNVGTVKPHSDDVSSVKPLTDDQVAVFVGRRRSTFLKVPSAADLYR